MAFTPEEIKAGLEAPFDAHQIKWRQGAYGKDLAYLDGPTVFRRLNECTNSWSFEIVKSSFVDMVQKGGEIVNVMIVEGHLEIPELGKRPGTGVQVIKDGSGEDMYKGAQTDAIKKAASLFGVGLHLYENATPITKNQGGGQGHSDQYAQNAYENQSQDYNYQQGHQGQGNQGQNQQGYQRATGERVRGGATVKQVNAIRSIVSDKGVDDQTLNMFIAEQTGGSIDIDDLTSRGASNIIGRLNDF